MKLRFASNSSPFVLSSAFVLVFLLPFFVIHRGPPNLDGNAAISRKWVISYNGTISNQQPGTQTSLLSRLCFPPLFSRFHYIHFSREGLSLPTNIPSIIIFRVPVTKSEKSAASVFPSRRKGPFYSKKIKVRPNRLRPHIRLIVGPRNISRLRKNPPAAAMRNSIRKVTTPLFLFPLAFLLFVLLPFVVALRYALAARAANIYLPSFHVSLPAEARP